MMLWNALIDYHQDGTSFMYIAVFPQSILLQANGRGFQTKLQVGKVMGIYLPQHIKRLP